MSLNVLRATERQEWLLELIQEYGSQKKAADFLVVDDAMYSRVLWQEYEPKDMTIRVKFRMSVKGPVSMNGAFIADGSQLAVSSRQCACGVDFVPNSSKRRKCFTCVPIRRK